jgi:hypothetical protein
MPSGEWTDSAFPIRRARIVAARLDTYRPSDVGKAEEGERGTIRLRMVNPTCVTIYDQSEDSTGVSFINGTTWVGDLGSGGTQGFLVMITPGDTLWLTAPNGEQGKLLVGTFVIPHVTVLPSGLNIRSVELASAKKRKRR